MIFKEIIEKRGNIFLDHYNINVNDIGAGIVFLYCDWSPTIVQLNILVDSLAEFPDLPLYIYNIDHDNFESYKGINHIMSHGYGETYWIKSDKIIFEIRNYKRDELEKLLYHNKMLGC